MTLGDIGLAVNQMQEPLVYIKPLPEPVSELTFDEQAHWPLPPRLDPESEFLFAVRVRSLGACPDAAAGFVGLWGQTVHLALVRANAGNPSQHTALLLAEMNFLAGESGLQNLPSAVCLVQIDRQLKPNEGRFVVHFYANASELSECAMKHRCQLARNVSLVLKNQAVYRSYFLSDFKREKYHQHCITPEGKWHPKTTCYELT